MITLFENFENNVKIQDYIKKQKGGFEIPNFNFNELGVTPKRYVQIKYNTLMRFYLYFKFLNYKGSNQTILNYINGLNNNDEDKLEIINKIPNNNTILGKINRKFNLGINKYWDNDLTKLKAFINLNEKILNDNDLVEYIKISEKLTKEAKLSEKIAKGVLVMLFGRYYNISKPSVVEDLGGVDIWMVNKETRDKYSVQVKNISSYVKFGMYGDTISIEKSKLDLYNYNSNNRNQKLKYDYLAFYLKDAKRFCIIKSTAIDRIRNGNRIDIELKDGASKDKNLVKIVNIPKRLLPKDYSKIIGPHNK